MDKWKTNQLKSIEISGNKFAKDKFNEYGVPKNNNKWEYYSDAVSKYKSDLAEMAKDELARNNPSLNENTQSWPDSMHSAGLVKEAKDVDFSDISVKEENKPTPEQKPVEYKEPTKYKKETVEVKTKTNGKKIIKTKKVKKVDFDFDFDNFKDFSSPPDSKKKDPFKDLDEEKAVAKGEDDEYVASPPKINKEEINKRFANKKAISSEDYANLDDNPLENNVYKNKLGSMKYSQAISSSDIYGDGIEEGK